ncbi:MAG: response regulator [Phycisphaerae bacterium]|nr:response regulator [Phycisphaerae bacterium]
MKVLIVDDNEAARRILQLYLAEYGTLVTVSNGVEAIEAFSRALEINEPFNLVCLDNAMPEMNGIEVLETIRKIECSHEINLNEHARIVMISAVDIPSEIKKAYESGCDSYMVKPSRKEKLIAQIHNLGLLK